MVRLYAQTGLLLSINSNGHVQGTEDETEVNTHLRITSSSPGCVQIQGVHSKMYLCFKENGRVYGESDINVDGTIFEELSFQGAYTMYKAPDKEWYVAIRKDGHLRKGPTSSKTTKERLDERKFLQKKEADG